MDGQINPTWHYASANTAVTEGDVKMPTEPGELRAAYYVCRQMIQLMENVFLDLELDVDHEHPANRGWMNLFCNWSWCTVFRAVWAVTASTYGSRFRDFCERRLGLTAVKMVVEHWTAVERGSLKVQEDLNFVERQIAQAVADHQKKDPGAWASGDGESLKFGLIRLVVSTP